MITPVYTAILGLVFIALSVNVVRGRRHFSVAIGDGDHHDMKRRIRAQANFSEYTPIFIIMLGYAEHGGLTIYAVHALGIIFLSGRLMHAYSLLKHEEYKEGKLAHNPAWRIAGMVCTFTTIFLLAMALLIPYAKSVFI